MTDSLLWANLCIDRIDRALRQLSRLQKAYARQSWEMDRLHRRHGELPRPMPKSWADLEARFQDHLYFFILTARQALKAVWVLEQRGEVMPAIRQEHHLRAWRDYLEHWDSPARGKPDKAGDTWREVSDEAEPGLSSSGEGRRLHEISGVQLKKLEKDLKKARRAAGKVSEREWSYCYIIAEEAAEILGMTLEEFEDLPKKPMHMDFGDDSGVRYWREWVEARRDGLAFPPAWASYLSSLASESDQDW
jgi:hypothetical protein